MIPKIVHKNIESLENDLKIWLKGGDDRLADSETNYTGSSSGRRLGTLSSISGKELLLLLLDPAQSSSEVWIANLSAGRYSSLTNKIPQAHWFERVLWDLFGIEPYGHPRLKHVLLHDSYRVDFYPLREGPETDEIRVDPQIGLEDKLEDKLKEYSFMEVKGEGVYEIPVGPIHAGIIEPGHFRFSCFGESIINLEIRLGYVHRGVEKRLCEVPWQRAHFIAEAAASDSPVANALAHAIAVESLLNIELSQNVQVLRTIALEIERSAMHIIDIGGIAGDIGLLGIGASLSRLRGAALAMAEALSGSRFMRNFIRPGGLKSVQEDKLKEIAVAARKLEKQIKEIFSLFNSNQVARDRMEGIGKVSKSLAEEFGLVGVAARAAGIAYDSRNHYSQGLYPAAKLKLALQKSGDIQARTAVRMDELLYSLDLIARLAEEAKAEEAAPLLKTSLPPNQFGLAVVEGFRGELIHLIATGNDGEIRRYVIKDPSENNWTALAIAIRSNLIADFPLCNKSFGLSYSGNDL